MIWLFDIKFLKNLGVLAHSKTNIFAGDELLCKNITIPAQIHAFCYFKHK